MVLFSAVSPLLTDSESEMSESPEAAFCESASNVGPNRDTVEDELNTSTSGFGHDHDTPFSSLSQEDNCQVCIYKLKRRSLSSFENSPEEFEAPYICQSKFLEQKDHCSDVDNLQINNNPTLKKHFKHKKSRYEIVGSPRLKRHGIYMLPLMSGLYGVNKRRRRQYLKSALRQRGVSLIGSQHEPHHDGTIENELCWINLPVELIMIVLEHCDFSTVHSLSATSKSFCDLAFRRLISIAGLNLPTPDEYLSNDMPHGVVDINTPEKALALSVWKRQKSFHCVSVLMLVLDLPCDETINLVDRILAFFSSPMPIEASFASTISIYTYSVEDYQSELCRLLYGLQNSGCSHLSISSFSIGFKRLPRSVEMPGIPLMEATDEGYNKLEVFKSHGRVPFLSAILPFTMNNILTSRLREFVFSTNDFTVGKWARFLQSLFLENLEILGLGGSISLVTVLKFLRRHRRLRHISLTGINIPFHPPMLQREFSLQLADLEFITAPSLYITEMLRYLPHAPGLSQIAVRTDLYRGHSYPSQMAFNRSAIKILFDQVKRFPGIRKIIFAFGSSGSTDFSDISQDLDLVQPETLLTHVHTISLRKGFGGPFEKEALAKTVDWLALFPSLATVEVFEDGNNDHSGWISALQQKGIVTVVQSV